MFVENNALGLLSSFCTLLSRRIRSYVHVIMIKRIYPILSKLGLRNSGVNWQVLIYEKLKWFLRLLKVCVLLLLAACLFAISIELGTVIHKFFK